MTPSIRNLMPLQSELDNNAFNVLENAKDLVLDSKSVTRGDVFVALRGETNHGLNFIDNAIDNGAIAVLYDRFEVETVPSSSIPLISINNLKQVLPSLAELFYPINSNQLSLIAVTGTNGKTTCAHLISQALNKCGYKSAMIGTIGHGYPQQLVSGSLTTPDVLRLRKYLSQFASDGIQAVAFEASSHGIEQDRLAGLKVNIAVFTNISHDHLDYHENFQAYRNAKLKLFQSPQLDVAVMNADAPLIEDFASKSTAKQIFSYGRCDDSLIRLLDVDHKHNNLHLKVKTPEGEFDFTSQLMGEINVENILAVMTTLFAYGIELKTIVEIIPSLKAVPGRMERFVAKNKNYVVIVDYAHTPDALQKALISLRPYVENRLICVFGCGGDRDKDKRPIMGKIAQDHADLVVITDDNPRHEASGDIIGDIQSGMQSQGKIISERPSAIQWAISQAQSGDVILLAGKGHETTQQIKDDVIKMSDREMVKRYLGIAS